MRKYLLLAFNLFLTLFAFGRGKGELPNVIIFLCDDLGYGDIGIFGNPTIKTPCIDKLAVE